jgi:FMN phosphatase YigB (HAD superfamily)
MIKVAGLDLIIFDLDFTLHDMYSVYPRTKLFLSILYRQGYILALASYNAFAPAILEAYNLRKYFHLVEYQSLICPEDATKNDHKKTLLESILYKTNIAASKALFFDDDIRNIDVARSMGLKGVLVNPAFGVQEHDMMYGLRLFL